MRLRRIVAEARKADNEPSSERRDERRPGARRVAVFGRLLTLAALVLAGVALAGLTPAPRAAGVVLLVTAAASAVEVLMPRRDARRSARFEAALLIARVAAVSAVVLAFLLGHWPVDLLPAALLLVILSSAAVLADWSTIAITAYASAALLAASRVVPIAHVPGIEGDSDMAVAAIVYALLVFPGAAWYVRHGLRITRGARESLERMRGRLGETETALRASQRELEGWNAQLQREVTAQTSELEERNRYLSIVSAVSFTLSDSMDGGDSLERAIRLVARLLEMRAGQAYQLGTGDRPGTSLFVPVQSDDLDAPRLPESVLRLAADHGNYVRSDQPGELALPDIGEPYVAAPLVAKGRVVGSFALIGSARRSLGEQEHHLLLLLGREIGIVLENGRLYHEAIERADREQLLAEAVRLMNGRSSRGRAMTQALELISRHLDAEVAALVALPEGPRKPQLVASVSSGHATVDDAIAHMLRGVPALISDRWAPMVLGVGGEAALSTEMAQRGVGTLVLAPVIAARSTQGLLPQRTGDPANSRRPSATRAMVGVLAVAMGAGSGWSAGRTEVVERISGILSRRMETDELLQLQRRRITELSGLAEIARLMQTGADSERLYSGFAQSLFTLLSYQDLYIARLDDAGAISEIPSFTAGGRPQPQPAYGEEDARHRWFGLRGVASWLALEEEAPSFVDRADRVGLVVPMRPKGQLLGLVVLGLSVPAQGDQVRIVEQAVEQLALALDGAALYRQATERASHIQALSNLARIVASVVDLREAFDAFAEEVRWLIPFERAVMLLMDAQSEQIEPYATYPEEPAARRHQSPLAGSLAEMVVEAGTPITLSRDDERYADHDWSAFGPDARQVAAVPVRHGTRTVAVFALVQSGETPYSANDLDALGEVAGLLGVTIERLRLYEQAEHSARHDALTGLPNYRYLQERLGRLHAGVDAPGSSAVFLVDMDSLKLFNDTLGHEAGDRVIQIVARALREAVSEHDFVARTGGDEFVVVMEGVTADEAETAARQMHTTLREAHLEFPNAPCAIGISVGVAMAPGDAETTGELMQLADHAMYTAKFNGGNRTVFATQGVTGNVPVSLRGRQSRLLELTMQACTDGATGTERAALARAERYVAGFQDRFHLDELQQMALRLLVAAEVGQRITPSGNVVNRRIADVLVRGARLEMESFGSAQLSLLAALPSALVELAWLQREAPGVEPLAVDAAMQRVRAQFADRMPRETLDVIEAIALADAGHHVDRRAA